jgi:hypothetical protein
VSLVGGLSRKNSSENDHGGFKGTLTSGTVEVMFMTDPAKRSSFNLCMRLRYFIKEAQVMYPSFRIMPLEGEGGDCINQPEDSILSALEQTAQCIWQNENRHQAKA